MLEEGYLVPNKVVFFYYFLHHHHHARMLAIWHWFVSSTAVFNFLLQYKDCIWKKNSIGLQTENEEKPNKWKKFFMYCAISTPIHPCVASKQCILVCASFRFISTPEIKMFESNEKKKHPRFGIDSFRWNSICKEHIHLGFFSCVSLLKILWCLHRKSKAWDHHIWLLFVHKRVVLFSLFLFMLTTGLVYVKQTNFSRHHSQHTT